MASAFGSSRAWLTAVVAIGITACSSGGGTSGGGTNGGPGGAPLTLSASAVSFSGVRSAAVPPAQLVHIAVNAADAAYVVGGYPPGSTPPSWLDLALTGAASSWDLHLTITTTSLPAATYSATVIVVIARADQSIIAQKTLQVSYTVREGVAASPAALGFQWTIGNAAPATQRLSVTGAAGTAFTVSADQPWVTLSSTSTTAPASTTVGVATAGLAPGPYSATITFLAGGQPTKVPVTLTVALPKLVVSPASLTLSGVAGRGVVTSWGAGVTLNTGSNAYTWTATAPDAWLRATPASGNVSGTVPSSFQATADAVGLRPGPYASELELTANVDGHDVTAKVPVTLSLGAPAITAPASVALGGASGHDLGARSFQLSIDTAANAFGWTASTSTPWLRILTPSGTASATAATVTIAPDATLAGGLAAGTYTGAVDVVFEVNGAKLPASVPVTLTLDEHRLLVSDDGVALSTTPGGEVLGREVRVRSNRGVTTTWEASADADWLSVTPSGTTDDALVLSADPTKLSADTVHQAKVTVTSDDPSIPGSATIRVGLWVGSTAPGSVTVTPAVAYTELAADPIRPYLYAHAGGADVTVYNAFTGDVVRTLAAVGSKLGSMAVSGDGSTLYVFDGATKKVVPVDLDAGQVGAGWALSSWITTARIACARTNGVPLVVASDGTVRDAATGAAFMAVFASAGDFPAVSRDGTRVCTVDGGISAFSGWCYALDYTTAGNQVVLGAAATPTVTSGYAWDLAVNADGTRLYTAAGSGKVITVYDATAATRMPTVTTLAIPDNFSSAVRVGADGRIYGAGRLWYAPPGSSTLPPDGWVWSATGTLQSKWSYRFARSAHGVLDHQLAVTGDGVRMAVLTDDPDLQIVTVGP